MSTPITFKNEKVYQSEVIISDISNNPNNNVYLTIHKTTPWSNEAAPPVANSTYSTIFELWDGMIVGKKINGSDMYHVVPRYNWTANTVYTECDQDVNYSNTQFYVLTSDYNVYKCISNNYGAASTTEPSSLITNNITETDDNYKWKYITTLTDTERERFLTDNFMPIKTLSADDFTLQWDVQQDAVQGAIYHTNITNGGSGYSNANVLSLTIVGDGSGANGYLTINSISNTVNSVVMDAYGTGYTYATATIVGGGSGATAKCLLSPPEGHGSNPTYELNGSYIMFSVQISGTENDAIVANNDFRQVAMILNPKKYGTSNVMGNSIFTQYTTLQMSSTGADYYNDEYVYIGSSLADSTFNGVVLDWDSGNSKLHLINTRGTVSSDILIGSNSAASRFVTSGVTNPACTPATGRYLYVENIVAVERSSDQTEEFRIVLGV